MKMTVRASVFALATMALFLIVPLAQAGEFNAMNGEQGQPSASVNIARIKSVLKLTPAQEPYWAPVETALRDLARQQARAESQDGFVHRISHRVVSVVLSSTAVHRLAVAARPLIAKLDEDQMRAAHGLATEMGLGPVVAALR
jgi:zinc resistance-associated protein